jgi:hypothetical protein
MPRPQKRCCPLLVCSHSVFNEHPRKRRFPLCQPDTLAPKSARSPSLRSPYAMCMPVFPPRSWGACSSFREQRAPFTAARVWVTARLGHTVDCENDPQNLRPTVGWSERRLPALSSGRRFGSLSQVPPVATDPSTPPCGHALRFATRPHRTATHHVTSLRSQSTFHHWRSAMPSHCDRHIQPDLATRLNASSPRSRAALRARHSSLQGLKPCSRLP